MKVYKLVIENILVGSTFDPVIEAEDEIYLPSMYCSDCGMRPFNYYRSLPQASRLTTDHPVLLAIKSAMEHEQEIKITIGNIMYDYYSKGVFPSEEEKEIILRGIDQIDYVTPEFLRNLINPLLKALKLPANYQLFPTERIGISTLRCRSKNIPDFSEATTPIVKQRVIDILKENNITGWESYGWPVKLSKYFKKKNETVIPQLWELSVVGNAGEPLGMKANVHYTYCSRCGYRTPKQQMRHFDVNMDTWDGSDVFHFEWEPGIYVTERFREVAKKNKLTNLKFELLSK